MTIPIERTYALQNTREFLRKLLDRKATPRVPLAIRREAKACLKHFPQDWEIERAAKRCPDIFGQERDGE